MQDTEMVKLCLMGLSEKITFPSRQTMHRDMCQFFEEMLKEIAVDISFCDFFHITIDIWYDSTVRGYLAVTGGRELCFFFFSHCVSSFPTGHYFDAKDKLKSSLLGIEHMVKTSEGYTHTVIIKSITEIIRRLSELAPGEV